jgi:DNA-binding LytR/AlgR family response regulator
VGCRSAEITADAESTIQRRSTKRRVCRSRGQVVRRIRCSGYAGPLHLEAVHPSSSVRVAGSRNERARGSVTSARATQDQKTIAREMFVQQAAHTTADVSASPLRGATIYATETKRDYTRESTTAGFCDATDTSMLPAIRVAAANLMRVLRQLEVIAKRQAPRIAFKAKGRILLLDLADILAVQAEGNYVSLRARTDPYLVHESLSSLAEKLKPYGFIRIHRSVVVNISAVEEIQPLPTGEYRLRVKGGKEYLVTRTYKHNLGDLAQLWVGSERLCG